MAPNYTLSAFWGILFNFISAVVISFITQDTKENNHKNKIHEFFSDHRNLSMSRRSLKPSAWIVTVAWIFFSIGPGLLIGNRMFGNPNNVESWSFGMPSIWVWQIIFWLLGVVLVWFLAFKMGMSLHLTKQLFLNLRMLVVEVKKLKIFFDIKKIKTINK